MRPVLRSRTWLILAVVLLLLHAPTALYPTAAGPATPLSAPGLARWPSAAAGWPAPASNAAPHRPGTLWKTVRVRGFSPSCAATTSITVDTGTEVLYCYTLTNTGDTMLFRHTLYDDHLGFILNDALFGLPPGGSAVVTATALMTQTTRNVATWTGTNATTTVTATASALVTVIVPPADLFISIDASVGTAPAGGSVAYAITAFNAGRGTAPDVEVAASLPAGLTFTAISHPAGWACTTPPVGSHGSLACTTASLAIGASEQLTLQTRVVPSAHPGEQFILPTHISGSAKDPDMGNNDASATLRVIMRVGLPLISVSPP